MTPKDKPIFVTRPLLPSKADYYKMVDRIWENHWITNEGPLLQEFTSSLKSFLSCDNLSLLVNGHLALETAIKGCKLTGEVITTPFTFASTAHAISLSGLKPVFADIENTNLTMDPDAIETLITDRTSAIIPVHVYGHPCNVDRITEIAEKHGLKVIYDAAHSFACRYRGKSLASYGDISMISFHATKLFNSIEGGALVYKEPALEQVFNELKNFGISNEVTINEIAGNAKMNEFQAAMGLLNLRLMDAVVAERRSITMRYREKLADITGISCFYPEQDKQLIYNYAYMPIRIKRTFGVSRDELYEKLKDFNIFSRRYFYPLLTDANCYKKECGNLGLTVAKQAAEEILCLPIYSGLSLDDVDYVCEAITEIRKAG